MQVNVFVLKAGNDSPPTLLVLPYGPMAAIPPHLQGVNWTYLATTTSDDKLIGAQSIAVEEDIGRVGYALVMRTG